MTSPSSGYRAVCALCKTAIVSSMPHGRFQDYWEATRVVRAHLLYRCERVQGRLGDRELDVIVDNSVEAIEGAA